MPFRPQFAQANRATERLNQFLTYDMLNAKASKRNINEMLISDELMKGRAEQGFQLQSRLEQQKSDLTIKEGYRKTLQDMAKMPPLNNLLSLVQMGLDPNVPQEYRPAINEATAKLRVAIEELSPLATLVLEGKLPEEQFNSVLRNFGADLSVETLREAGMNARAYIQKGIEEGKLGIERGKLQQEQAKVDDTQRLEYKKYVEDTIDYLVGEGVVSTRGLVDPVFLSNKSPDPMSSQNRGKALENLNFLRERLIKNEPLTEGNLAFIRRAWNTFQVERGGEAGAAGGAGVTTVAPGGGGVGRVPPELEATAAERAAEGGLPGVETGTTAGEQSAIKANLRLAAINYYTDYWLKTMGYEPGQASTEAQSMARQRAIEYVESLGVFK